MPATDPQPSDADLLHRYAQTRNPDTFRQLATRHLDWIYSTALRLTRNPALAEDVTQGVLLALSQKAAALARHPALISWLFRATRYGAGTLLRAERRRKQHEAAAMPTHSSQPSVDTDWLDIQPRLDAAMAQLSAADRHVLLLRFYQQFTHPAVAATLDISEEAARKRVERALDQLRKLLGVKSTTTSLAALLTASALTAAPTHLQAAIASASLATPQALAISKGVHTMLMVAKIKWAAAIVVAALLPVTFVGWAVSHRTPTQEFIAAPPTAASAPPLAATGPFTGIVVNEKNQPAANVLVQTPETNPPYSARTSADGHFTLQLPDTLRNLPALLATTDDQLHQAYVAPRPLDAPRNIRLTLAPARQFAITVQNDQQQPVDGAIIYVVPGATTTPTDALGKATVHVAAALPIQYIVALKDHVGFDYQLFRQPLELRTDPYRLAPDFTGPLAFTLSGARSVLIRAVDEQGQPLAGVPVHPWYIERPRKGGMANLSYSHLFEQKTNAGGIAEFAYLPPDTIQPITFWVRLPGYTSPQRWEWNPKAPHDAITATLHRMIPLTGIVHDAQGRPVSDATVRIAGADCVALDDFRGDAQTKADGTFSIEVDPEKYYIFFAQKDDQASLAATRIVHHKPPTDPLQLTLAPAIRVFGQLTAGKDNHPVTRPNYLSLHRRDHSYRDVPANQKLPPDPAYPARGLTPMTRQSAKVDAQGNFEFYTIPGDYYIDTSVGSERIMENFILENETEKEVVLHAQSDAPVLPALRGRVVISGKPDAGVPEASLSAVSADLGLLAGFPKAITHRDGAFEIRRPDADFYLHAASPDKSHQAILLLTPKDPDNLTITLLPTTTATGRLVDQHANPLSNRRLDWGFHIGKDGGAFMTLFGDHTTTAADGTFTLTGLVPGIPYEIDLATSLDAAGRPAAWTTIGKAATDSSTPVHLGDLAPPLYAEHESASTAPNISP